MQWVIPANPGSREECLLDWRVAVCMYVRVLWPLT